MKKIYFPVLVVIFILISALSYFIINQQPKQTIKIDLQTEDQCKSALCDEEIEVLCTGDSCNPRLLKYYFQLQTRVVQCLENYFQFSAPRVTYNIHSVEKPLCEQDGGCCCTTGGSTDWSGISQSNLFGNTQFRARTVENPEDIIAEEHETTHFFLYHMLKGHPAWFSEAISIEINERINCDISVMDLEGNAKQFVQQGDAYLRETEMDKRISSGILMNDGSKLNEDFYKKLKQGDVSLNENERKEPHIRGALWIIGLKEDYGCEEQCVLRIVKELQTYTESQCKRGTDCGDNPLQFPDIITNEMVKEKTDLVIGVDTRELFEMLGIYLADID